MIILVTNSNVLIYDNMLSVLSQIVSIVIWSTKGHYNVFIKIYFRIYVVKSVLIDPMVLTIERIGFTLPTGDDCFQLAKAAYMAKDYHHALMWLKETLQRQRDELADNKTLGRTLSFLSYSHYKVGPYRNVKPNLPSLCPVCWVLDFTRPHPIVKTDWLW